MIDLHIHSIYSDGTDSVIELLKKAQNKKLTYISITDHNTCSAYEKIKEIDLKKYYSGKIISGIELNTTVLGIPIEVLGYDVDTELMQKNLKGIYLTSKERNYLELERLFKKCIQAGIELNEDFVINYSSEKYVSEYLHEVLTRNEKNRKLIDDEAWNDSLALYRKYMSDPNSIFFVDMNDVLPNFEKVTELVKKSRGKLFLPHIFEYKHNANKILRYIIEKYQIDGIECYYPSFTKHQTQQLLNLCMRKNFFISGGSDYHGLNSPGIEMGIGKGNLRIAESILLDWK